MGWILESAVRLLRDAVVVEGGSEARLSLLNHVVSRDERSFEQLHELAEVVAGRNMNDGQRATNWRETLPS